MNASRDDVTTRIVEHPAGHLRVLGPPGSGKTRLVIERYRALTRAGSRAFILTYSREQLKQVTASVLESGAAHAGLSPVQSYFTLAREIVSDSGRPVPRIIEGIEELLLVRQVVHKYATKFKSDYRTIKDSQRFLRDLLAFCHLMLQNDVRQDALGLVESAAASARLADALALYRLYLERLAAGGRVTFYDLSWFAADACKSLPDTHPLRQADVWLVDDFQDIDAGQFALLHALLPPDGGAVNVFGDPMGSFFAFRGTSARYLMREFPERYPCETVMLGGQCLDDGPLSRTLETLAGETLGDGARDYLPLRSLRPAARAASPPGSARQTAPPSPGPLFDRPVGGAETVGDAGPAVAGVQLEITDDEVDEAYTAASRVHDLIAGERYRPYEIAVIANEKHRYEPLLRAAFEQRGIPLDTGRPPQGGFRGFVQSLLTLIETPGDPVAMEALTTSPFHPYFRAECLELSGRPIDTEGERDAVRRHLQATADDLRSKEPGERMTHVMQRSFIPACAAYHHETDDELVYAFLSVLGTRWEEYAAALEATHGQARFGEFMRISGLFATQSLTAMPSVDEVGFYSCREVKGRFFPAVLVLGCSELLFPSVMKREGLVPAGVLQDSLTRALPDRPVAVYGARSAQDHLQEEYHLLYHALTRAKETLYISAPRMFAGQARPAPASVLKRAWPEDRYHETKTDERTPPQIRFARAWVGGHATPGLAGRLGELNLIGPLWNLPGPTAEPFELEAFRISQGSLKRFAKCPRYFFYEKILRLQSEENAAMTVGSLFHKIMATLADNFPAKKQLHTKADDTFVAELIDDLLRENRIQRGTLFDTTLRHYLPAMVRSTLKEDQESEDYSIVLHEELVPFECGGRGFHGQMDRIEKTASGFHVLDFKTGSIRKQGVTIRGHILDTPSDPVKDDWQVPMYVMASREKTEEWPRTFKYLGQEPGEDPILITLYVVGDDEQLPPAAESNTGDCKRYSYLRHEEIEGLMQRAVEHVDLIFSSRTGFERTEKYRRCRNCRFMRLCNRNA